MCGCPATFGQYTQGAEFSFTEPYFLGYRLAAGFDLYWKETSANSYTAYDSQTVGGGVRFGLPITDEVTLALRYNLYQRELSLDNCTNIYGTSITANNCGVSWAVIEAVQQGATITSVAGYTLSFNGLDSNQSPTSGMYAELKQDFAGLGGDVQFIRTTGDVRLYYPIIATGC